MITLNVPHASLTIPDDIKFNLLPEEIKDEAKLMGDMYTDELFDEQKYIKSIKATVSRIVVDTERFTDDNIEVAAQYGMGVIYTRTHDKKILRDIPSMQEKENLLSRFYYPHHQALNQSVEDNLNKYNKALIIDLHSYLYTVDILGIGNKVTPDICIGFEDFHKHDKVLQDIIDFCKKNNLSYDFNTPFSGSIVPLQYYQKDSRVSSFMIEIKKTIYMDETTYQKKNLL